jgi:manganese/zinc/iron transport system substrate-binding protein
MKKIVLVVLTLSLLLSACATESGGNSNGKLNIVTTTGMIADIVKNVGGEYVEVTSLMGPGVDPHLYKASEGDIRRLQDANLIFYNGLHLEAQLGEVLEKMNDFNITTVAVADEIDRCIACSPRIRKFLRPAHLVRCDFVDAGSPSGAGNAFRN